MSPYIGMPILVWLPAAHKSVSQGPTPMPGIVTGVIGGSGWCAARVFPNSPATPLWICEIPHITNLIEGTDLWKTTYYIGQGESYSWPTGPQRLPVDSVEPRP